MGTVFFCSYLLLEFEGWKGKEYKRWSWIPEVEEALSSPTPLEP